MADGVVSIDGRLFDPEEARISVFDRGFLFGDSVFEAMRTYGREPLCGMRHLQRLARSCERVLLSLPVGLAQLREEIDAAIAASALPECYVRVVISRGVGPLHLDLETASRPSRFIFVLPVRELPSALYVDGVGVRLVHVGRGADAGRDVGAKSSNYLTHLLAAHQVRTQGAHEALLVGALGELLEGATSNLFLIRQGQILTPPVRSGVLAGITRSIVLKLVDGMGLSAMERPLFPWELYSADEAFITSSIREVVPVVEADDVSIGAGRPGPLVQRLMGAYRDFARTAGWDG